MAELKLPVPLIPCNNQALPQIRENRLAGDIEPVGVPDMNPDFIGLAKSCYCSVIAGDSTASLISAVNHAFKNDRPTLIEINESDARLNAGDE